MLGKKSPKNVPSMRPVDHMIQDKRQGVLSLRKRKITIEVSHEWLDSIVGFFWNYRLRLGLVVLLLLVVGVVFVRQTRADVIMYPHTCLGGWEQSEKAAGPADADETNPASYTSSNSASVGNAIAQIFCASFTATIPDHTNPTHVQVHISWTSRVPTPVVIDGSQSSLGTASSTNAIIDAPPDAILAAPLSTSTNSTASSTVPIVAPPAPKSPDVVPVPVPLPVPASAPVPASSSSASAASSVMTYLTSLFSPEYAYAANIVSASDTPSVASTTPSVLSSPTTASTTTSSDSGKLEVLYTLDGTTWISLGTVSRQHLTSSTFDIPLTSIKNWSDLSQLQVSVRSLSSISDVPTVYLDSMWLSVAYSDGSVTAPEDQTPTVDPVIASKTWTFTNILSDSNLEGRIFTPNARTITLKGVRGTNFRIYNPNNPKFSIVVGIGDAAVEMEIYNFHPGTFIAVDTSEQNACATLSLEKCRLAPGYQGEVTFSIIDTVAKAAATTVVPTIVASTTVAATTTSP